MCELMTVILALVCPLLFRATPIDCFVDYIRGGCQINLMLAIDFTVSDIPFITLVQMLCCINQSMNQSYTTALLQCCGSLEIVS